MCEACFTGPRAPLRTGGSFSWDTIRFLFFSVFVSSVNFSPKADSRENLCSCMGSGLYAYRKNCKRRNLRVRELYFPFPRRGDHDLTRVTSHGNRRCEYTVEALAKNFSNPPSILFFSARIVRFSRARMMRFSLEGRQ